MQKLIINIGISVVVILVAGIGSFFGTRAWVDYETRKVEDAWRMSQVTQIHAGLVGYYKDHAAYPSSNGETIILGGLDSACLTADGFVSPVSHACKKQAYLPHIEAGLGKTSQDVFTYRSLAQDDASPCQTKTPCPSYAIRFYLATGSMLPGGVHTLTPKSLK
ncbi:hypothetical protein HYW94_02140 [Candidatus Uhrbacteria bacterium]|nr:hypothetical protein [Candidatus Uhrbacteria bacterium]